MTLRCACRSTADLEDTKVFIKHRASQRSLDLVEKILSCFGSKHVHLTAEKHDRITADTQAVTHAAFLRYVNTPAPVYLSKRAY